MKNVIAFIVGCCCFVATNAFACHPTLLCVDDLGGDKYKAHFGYVGKESYIAIGSNNKFSGSPSINQNQGQGTNFSQASVADHVQVNFSGSATVSWKLKGTTVTASKSSKKCATPTPSPTPTCSPSPSPTKTPTPSPTSTPTNTPTPSPTKTPTPSPTCTPPTPSPTPTLPPVDCKGIPGGHAVVDLCGVCGGDNSTCKDCKGLPNGTSKLDLCGVCDGDNSTCKDCSGVPNGKLVLDECAVCGGDNSTCKDCKGVPNGKAVIDSCGVCDGQSNTCLDCAGIPNGGTKIDACGICGGPGGKHVSFKERKQSLRKLADTIFNKKTVPYFKGGIACANKSGNKKLAKKFEKEVLASKVSYEVFISVLSELDLDVEVCPGQCALLENQLTIKKLLKLNKVLYSYASKAQHGARGACNNTGPGKADTKIISDKLDREIKKCPSGKICK